MKMATRRTVLGGLGLLVSGGAFWFGSGPVGLLVAGLTLLLWYLAPACYAVTFGQVALATLVVPTSSAVVITAGECGLLVLLLDPLVANDAAGVTRNRTLVGLGCIAAAGGGTWFVYSASGTLWVPTVALVAVLALSSYGLHRYETAVRKTVNGERGAEVNT